MASKPDRDPINRIRKISMAKTVGQFIATWLVAMSLLSPLSVWAAMSSTNYYIYADSVNVGGLYSASGSYSLEDTMGEAAVGTMTSTSYTINGGYQAMDLSTIGMSISSSSLFLGNLTTPFEVKAASTTVSMSTDSETGYTLSISAVSGTHLADVTDGQVSGDGTEEYGLGLSGPDRLITNDTAVTAPKNLSSTSTYTETSRDTELGFKAARAATSTIGTYTQTITLSGSINF